MGSAVGMGALPLIALLVLDSSAFRVSLLAALSAVASGVIALPLGVHIEHQYKRPVMITADLARCVLLASVPVAMAFGRLTFAQLCVVGVLQTAASVAFSAASGAHLKALVLPEYRLRANSLFETTNWISVSAGPPVGGLLIGESGLLTQPVVNSSAQRCGARSMPSPTAILLPPHHEQPHPTLRPAMASRPVQAHPERAAPLGKAAPLAQSGT
ncbi:MFS transporter, partial [Streptomyces sp. NPDC088354]|uniref:MFS transporter n=1 Tax=Streptomyces sp. NPDC088354 TaxID=3365856 RepID=UPI0037F2BE01